jgi:hypothetical protein
MSSSLQPGTGFTTEARERKGQSGFEFGVGLMAAL